MTVPTAIVHLRSSPFLSAFNILFAGQSQVYGPANEFNADKKGDERRCTQMFSDHFPFPGSTDERKVTRAFPKSD
jgi:hypothetical protein